MFVRIVDVPPGEAPEEVRRAWVGLELPLVAGETGPRPVRGVGVLSGPRTFFGQLLALLTGRSCQAYGYVIDAHQALVLLAEKAPWAAQWWRESAPHAVEPGRRFIFAAEVCERAGRLRTAPPRGPARTPSDEFFPGGPADVTRNRKPPDPGRER
jgi:hypothetical protein